MPRAGAQLRTACRAIGWMRAVMRGAVVPALPFQVAVQVTPTSGDTPMRTPSFVAGTLAGIALAASVAGAQGAAPTLSRKALSIAPYAGYMTFGRFVDGPLGSSLTSSGGAMYGAQLDM